MKPITQGIPANEFTLTRILNAPRKLVFDAFTKAEHLAHWWGPKGFAITVKTFDLRPEGIFHYRMNSADGTSMWGKFIFKEIIIPEKITWLNTFADEHGKTVRGPFGNWPLEIKNTVTFTANEGKTILHLAVVPVNANDEERAIFEAGFESMNEGYSGTFDKLDHYIASFKK
jgi:uncharacterized protein YndB with AHSA1/START domain